MFYDCRVLVIFTPGTEWSDVKDFYLELQAKIVWRYLGFQVCSAALLKAMGLKTLGFLGKKCFSLLVWIVWVQILFLFFPFPFFFSFYFLMFSSVPPFAFFLSLSLSLTHTHTLSTSFSSPPLFSFYIPSSCSSLQWLQAPICLTTCHNYYSSRASIGIDSLPFGRVYLDKTNELIGEIVNLAVYNVFPKGQQIPHLL